MTYESLDDRIKKETEKSDKKIEFQRSCQDCIDFIENNAWLLANDKAVVRAEISTWFSNLLTFRISNVDITEFIEEVLGPYHRVFNINWKLNLSGNKSEPVFVFTDVT